MKQWIPLALAMAACATQAADQPPRWVKADDLRVRAGPGVEHRVVGVLQRGAQLVLKDATPHDGFCLIEGDGQYGYVACQYLSAELVARPRAGQGGVPADRRWVTGTAVNLRAAPALQGEVLARLAVNGPVQLLKADAGPGYCEVQPLDRTGAASGPRGFAACQYLGLEALPAAQAAGQDDDPVKAFWRAPGWWPLEAYARTLAEKLQQAQSEEVAKAGPWPRDAELERMKAHLALGLKGPAPKPLADWAALKALAAANDPALQKREALARDAANRLSDALGLHGELDPISADGGAERVLRLVRALELPTVRPSLFKAEAELGPPGEGPQEAAGRFGGIYRTVIAPRKPRDTTTAAGLYDMLSHTQALTRPVQQVRLLRDGTLTSEATTRSATETLWRDVDEPMCNGWVPGFAFGDVDGPIWNYFNDPEGKSDEGAKQARRDAGLPRSGPPRLFAYNALQPPPRAKAQRSEQTVKLDRAATGFVRFTQLGYDLDGDGVPDLLVLEGTGRGPGHLGGPTTTDDPWYRLLLANVNGAWKVLASDSFGYGCGC